MKPLGISAGVPDNREGKLGITDGSLLEVFNTKTNVVITNLDFLLTLGIFKGIAKWDVSKLNIEEFTRKFNDFFFIQNGFDDAIKINIDMSKEYTEQQVIDYILAVQNTIRLQNTNVEIKKIQNIPYSLAGELYSKVGTSISEMMRGDISFGIFRGNEMIGYVVGKFWDLGLSIKGFYVNDKNKGNGYGQMLLAEMMEESVKKGFNRLDISNASWEGQNALLKLARKYDEDGQDVQFESGSEDLVNYAILELNNKGNPNSYFKSINTGENLIIINE